MCRNLWKSVEGPSSLRSWRCIFPCSDSIWFCWCPWVAWWFCDSRVPLVFSPVARMATHSDVSIYLLWDGESPHCPAIGRHRPAGENYSIVDSLVAMPRLDDVMYGALRHSPCLTSLQALLRRCPILQLKSWANRYYCDETEPNAVESKYKPAPRRRLFRWLSVVHLLHVHLASGFDLIFRHFVS